MPGPTLTRRELYDLVWSTPMSKLVVRYGISDVELKKTCVRHQVPTLPRGYWVKLEAWHKPAQVPLAAVNDARLDWIRIGSSSLALPEPVRRVIEAQKAERKRAVEPAQKLEPNADGPIIDVHPAVRRTVQVLRRCKPVYQRRTMTPAKLLLTNCKHTIIRILGGVTISADRDPTYQRDLDDAAMS